jgi:RNA polymerase sigma factor (sigma-70 family)
LLRPSRCAGKVGSIPTLCMITIFEAHAVMERELIGLPESEAVALIYSGARKYMMRGVEVDEWCQDFAAHILRNTERYDPLLSKPSTWVYACARNYYLNRLNSHKAMKHVSKFSIHRLEGETIDLVSKSSESQYLVDFYRLDSDLRSALRFVPEIEKEVVVKQLDGISKIKQAKICGVTRQMIDMRYKRALGRLKDRMVDLGYGHDD